MHWVYRQEAKYNIGVELSRRGWTVYGLDHGKLELETDYYEPPSWDGIAEKDGLILCVDFSGWKQDHYCSLLGAKIACTPKGKTWHLQDKEGHIITTGTGLEPCSRYGEEGRKAAARLVDRIEEKANRPPAGRVPGFQRDGSWTWIKFEEKPSPEVLEALKASGWRWSRRREAWYHSGGAEPPEVVNNLLKGGEKA